ncbi:uncharacterized protein MAM_03623 [Metarhizium album ARSEF 1941]|uniref:Uncharacterized protein n=1 Tax=Metarhizium album (strain ARSEF 1941) TaxID=1081103 RepID=A0A0B2WY21_METAS|nr:uncharacterized protein MAM_03623 [Metarhizium album ARSEF 1941]KHN98499.1 hypothetical protein MAM_03623 [Metarhizium album ARSEF 1941]
MSTQRASKTKEPIHCPGLSTPPLAAAAAAITHLNMSWEAFGHGQSVVSFVSGIVTVVGAAAGLIAAGQQINKRNFENKFGPTHYEKDWMGYFAMKVPPWFKALVQPVPQPPNLPAVSGLITAGDDGMFTSSMVAWMQPGYQKVSWLALYEAFFVEYAWDCLWTGKEAALRDEDFSDFVDKAKEEVQRKIEKAEYGDANAHPPVLRGVLRLMRSTYLLLAWAISHAVCSTGSRVIHAMFPCPSAQTAAAAASGLRVETISPLLSEIPVIDHHLLYYKWGPTSTNSKTIDRCKRDVEAGSKVKLSRCAGPLLVKSLHLKRFETSVWSSYDRGGWPEDRRKLWTYKGKPCLVIFRHELESLAAFLGIQLKLRRPRRPEGTGAFGAVLVSEEDSYTHIRLIYERPGGHEYKPAGGSGYSTLFAKHMVCGCLPFAHTVSEDQSIVVHTAVVSEKTKQDVKAGTPFDSRGAPPSDESFPPPLSNSGLAVTDYCFPYPATSSGDGERECQGPGSLSFMDGKRQIDAGTWSDAVAGVAFGGLVPMATSPLIDIVAYVVGGRVEKESELSAFWRVMTDICEHAKRRVPGAASIPLFGSAFDSIAQASYCTPASFHDLFTGAANVDEVVWVLSLYTTMLEYLMAAIAPGQENRDADAEPQPQTQTQQSPVQLVFEACVAEISQQYEAAVRATDEGTASGDRSSTTVTADQETEIETTLKEISDKLKNNEDITVQDCGRVARCIIMAWARLVKTVSWEKEEKKKKEKKRDAHAGYVVPPTRDLPYIAAWE